MEAVNTKTIAPEILELRLKMEAARSAYYNQRGTYDEMIAATQELVDAMNERGAQIAKRHNRRHKPITVASVLRR